MTWPAALPPLAALGDLLREFGAWFETAERSAVHFVTCGLYVPWLDPVLLALQEKVVALPLMVFVLVVYAFRAPRRALRVVLSCVVGFGVAMLLASILWVVVDRKRPPQCYEQVLVGAEELAACESRPDALPLRAHAARSASFPSRHALTVGVFAVVLWLAWRPLGWGAIVYGLLVLVGRVYAGKHWPSDVVVGAALGGLVGWGVWRVLPRILRPLGVARWIGEPSPEDEPAGG